MQNLCDKNKDCGETDTENTTNHSLEGESSLSLSTTEESFDQQCILYYDARSLYPKLDELRAQLLI